MAVQYVRYSSAVKKLIVIMDILESPIVSLRLRTMLEPVFVRLLDIRKSLGDLSREFMDQVLIAAAVSSPLDIGLSFIPLCFKGSRDRVDHLVSVFSPHVERLKPLPEIDAHDYADTVLPKSIPLDAPVIEPDSAPRVFRARKSVMLRSLKDRNAAATKIGAFYRMYRARKAFVAMRQKELEFYEIVPNSTGVMTEAVDRSRLIIKKRKILQKLALDEFEAQKKSIIVEFEKAKKLELMRSFVPSVMCGFWEFSAVNCGKFPDSIEQLVMMVETGKGLKLEPEKESSKKPKKQSSSKPSSKKKKVISPPPPTSLDLLRTAVAQFSSTYMMQSSGTALFDESTFEFLEGKAALFEKIKRDLVIGYIHPELSKSSGRTVPLNTPSPETPKETHTKKPSDKLPPIPVPEKVYEEQDLIDLVKEGFVELVREDAYHIASDLKSSLFHQCILPLLFRSFLPFLSQVICIYGPSGWGKTSLVHFLATESKSVLFNLNPEILKTRKESTESLANKIVSAAKNNTPSVILLDGVEEIFPRPEKKKKGQENGAPAKGKNALGKYRPLVSLLKEKIAGLSILLVVIVNSPACNTEFFSKRNLLCLKLPIVRSVNREELITMFLTDAGVPLEVVYGDVVLLETLQRITDRLPPKEILTVLKQVVTPERMLALKRNRMLLRTAEFVEPLAKMEPIGDDTAKEWEAFTARINEPCETQDPKPNKPGRPAKL